MLLPSVAEEEERREEGQGEGRTAEETHETERRLLGKEETKTEEVQRY